MREFGLKNVFTRMLGDMGSYVPAVMEVPCLYQDYTEVLLVFPGMGKC